VSFFYCSYDADRRRLVYCNAGHNPPCLVRANGAVIWLAPGGPVLGILPRSRFEQIEIQLEIGDRLVLFTDGITEVRNEAGVEFGEERLRQLAVESRHSNARDLQRRLVSAARAFGGGAFADDATLIVMAAEAVLST
jgi:sigma-B regulation protein RsbU (phosphoserine phosphatase)